ncbi:hypothetical protein [Novosphingobium cyanobacteriorum]|uniref:Uncharacterized protein n=1 Tax=Novosphingobium cyanobacteriorum TaxID=3024215 RepID=A0ABT6CEN1_9SPHN|nr:hypothetical protein [Novosphingobium cyanobacteriorum]MDF8332384.1 hypothetical protein [Novosphingobium cyanobacteriorum]
MRVSFIACAALAAMVPAVAQADDPYDPAMRTHAARERDRAIIRQLNMDEAARVQERDARYAEGWRAWREQGGGHHGDQERYRADQQDYARRQAQYQRDMADWRRRVAACRNGDYDACD